MIVTSPTLQNLKEKPVLHADIVTHIGNHRENQISQSKLPNAVKLDNSQI
jgi:hypothetical protein